jgi:hypothetical protein
MEKPFVLKYIKRENSVTYKRIDVFSIQTAEG